MFGKKSATQSGSARFRGRANDPVLDVDTKVGIDRALRFAKSDPDPIESDSKKIVREALGLLEMAVMGIDSITETLKEARTIAEMAKMVDESQTEKLEVQFDELCSRLDSIVEKSASVGQCLLDGHNHNLQVPLTGKANSLFIVRIVDVTQNGLGIPAASGRFGDEEDALEILTEVDRALDRVRHVADMYCANASALANHYDQL